MAGEAKTNAFMLATATVMVGPTDQLFALNEAEHSVGLVKNFQITAEPTYQELTQGVKNTIVYSVMTQNPVRCQMEVYEYTSKNLAYGLGLDGSALAAIATDYSLKTQIVGGAGTGATGMVFTAADATAQFPAGTWFYIQDAGTDRIHVSRALTAAYATGDNTVTFSDDVPTGVTLPAGSTISKMNSIDIGSKAEQPYLAAKIVGIMSDGNKPLVLLIPKLRIVKGFTMGFQSDNYANMPFEFTPYDLVSTDTNYALFKDSGPVKILSRQ